jgi:hypothetical protein
MIGAFLYRHDATNADSRAAAIAARDIRRRRTDRGALNGAADRLNRSNGAAAACRIRNRLCRRVVRER